MNTKTPKTTDNEDTTTVESASIEERPTMIKKVQAFGTRHKNKIATAAIGLLSGVASGIVLSKTIDVKFLLETDCGECDDCTLVDGDEEVSEITENPEPTDD